VYDVDDEFSISAVIHLTRASRSGAPGAATERSAAWQGATPTA